MDNKIENKNGNGKGTFIGFDNQEYKVRIWVNKYNSNFIKENGIVKSIDELRVTVEKDKYIDTFYYHVPRDENMFINAFEAAKQSVNDILEPYQIAVDKYKEYQKDSYHEAAE